MIFIGKPQERNFRYQKIGGCQATAVCVIKADKQASKQAAVQGNINKREEKETGRYAKQNDT